MGIDQARFLQSIELAAGLDREAAKRAADAVLATLAERCGAGPAAELAAGLPPELRDPLEAAPADGEAFGPDELIARVAAREGTGLQHAAAHVRAVLATLRLNVAAFERLELPPEFEPLFGDAPPGRP